jgi:hypothetical protein
MKVSPVITTKRIIIIKIKKTANLYDTTGLKHILLRRPRAKPGHVRMFSDWLRGRPREKSANGVTDEVGE